MFNKVFWAVFRVSYFVNAIFWVGVLAVRTFPPADGNYAREFGGSLAINTLMVIITWAFVPLTWWGTSKARAKAAPEPENSHPGRVIPPGMPITRALREAASDLNEPQREAGKGGAPASALIYQALSNSTLEAFSQRPASAPAPHEPGKGQKFSVGQWVRHESTGQLAQLVSAGGARWWSYRGRWGEGGCPETTLSPALPHEGEWWQKRSCPKVHPLPKGTGWCVSPVKWCYTVGEYTSPRCGASKPGWDALFAAERDACECGCLSPLNFGKG